MKNLLNKYYSGLQHTQKVILQVSGALLAAAIFAPFGMLILAIVYKNRHAFLNDFERGLSTESKWPLALAFGALPIIWLTTGQFPLDDGWRHLTAWQHAFNYRDIYFELSPAFPSYSLWIGFELITGLITKAIGVKAAICVVQAFTLGSFTLALWFGVCKHVEKDRPYIFSIFFMLLMSSGLGLKLLSARPENLWIVMIVAAFSMHWIVWTVLAILLQPIYWLGIIYAPVALILNTSNKNKCMAVIAIALSAAAFWLSYSDGQWASFFGTLKQWLDTRLISAGENQALPLGFMAMPASLLFLLLATKTVLDNSARNYVPLLIVIGWFAIPNQLRYVGTITIVTAFIALPLIANYMGAHYRLRLPVLAACFILAINATNGTKPISALPQFKTLHAGDHVITGFDASTYMIPALNKGVRVAPPMEVGAATPKMQQILLTLGSKGVFDCSAASDTGYTHLSETTITEIPKCLELQEISGGWRLWRRVAQ